MSHLESTGTHEYDLRNPPERMRINTAEGTATLRQPLQSAQAISAGSLKAVSLRCTGTLNTARLEVTNDITITGLARQAQP